MSSFFASIIIAITSFFGGGVSVTPVVSPISPQIATASVPIVKNVVAVKPKTKRVGVISFTEVPAITKKIVGYDTYYIFESNLTGVRIKKSITHDEYLAFLAKPKKDNPQPQLFNYLWVGAVDAPIIATSTRVLSDNEYAFYGKDNASSSLVRVKKQNEVEKIILETEL